MTTIKEALQLMYDAGTRHLDIYYAELISDGETDWSVDVMCDPINDMCESSWTWEVWSIAEMLNVLDEDTCFVCADWEIITNKPFSEAAVREAISEWLVVNELVMQVRVIDIDDAAGSGYVRKLQDMDLEHEIKHSTPLSTILSETR